MNLTLSDAFQRDVSSLPNTRRAEVFAVLLALPDVLRDPGRHSGLGVRKLHPAGIWEARLGLDLRILFALRKGEIVVWRVGDHDLVRRFLRQF